VKAMSRHIHDSFDQWIEGQMAIEHAKKRKDDDLVNDAGTAHYAVADELSDMSWPHGALYRALHDVGAARKRILNSEHLPLVRAWLQFLKNAPNSKAEQEQRQALRTALYSKIPAHEKYKLLNAYAVKHGLSETFKRFKAQEDEIRREAALDEAKQVMTERDAKREELLKRLPEITGRSHEGLLRDAVDLLLKQHKIMPPGTKEPPRSKVTPMVFN
jgi:hypothetical protein